MVHAERRGTWKLVITAATVALSLAACGASKQPARTATTLSSTTTTSGAATTSTSAAGTVGTGTAPTTSTSTASSTATSPSPAAIAADEAAVAAANDDCAAFEPGGKCPFGTVVTTSDGAGGILYGILLTRHWQAESIFSGAELQAPWRTSKGRQG